MSIFSLGSIHAVHTSLCDLHKTPILTVNDAQSTVNQIPENDIKVSFFINNIKKKKKLLMEKYNNKNKTHYLPLFQLLEWSVDNRSFACVTLTSSSVCRCWSWKTLWRKSKSFSLQSVKAWISSKLSNTWDTAPAKHARQKSISHSANLHSSQAPKQFLSYSAWLHFRLGLSQ